MQKPLLFLDYYVTDKLQVDTASKVIEGMAEGCKMANCSLVGGETAEHPGSFPDSSFDLAGFSLGVVDEEKMIGTDGPKNGDVLVGISSSGFHSNGFSLIRKVLENYKISLDDEIEGESLGTILLKPTNIYVKEVLNLSKLLKISSIAHITGGGFFENIPRMLNKNQKVDIAFNFSDWPSYKHFKWIQDVAKISEENMLKTFNCGIGLVIAISPKDEKMALDTLNQSSFYAKTIGSINEKQGNEPELNFV